MLFQLSLLRSIVIAALVATAVGGCESNQGFTQGFEFPRLAGAPGGSRADPARHVLHEDGSSGRRGFFWQSSASTSQAGGPRGPASTAALASAGKDGVTLNLVEAPIAVAAKAVLGDILNANYVVDNRVTGTVTVQTTEPVSQAALVDIFDAVLRGQGAAMVVDGGLHKIVPANEMIASGAQLNIRGDGRPLGPGASVFVVPLTHVAASEMEQVLASVAPENSILYAGDSPNMLMLTGTRAEIAAMTEVIDLFDINEMRGMSFAMFPVHSADPEAVAAELDSLFGNGGGGPRAIRFVPNRRLDAVLAMSQNPDFLRQADELLLHLEAMGNASEREIFSYKVRNRPPAELAELLMLVYSGAAPSGGDGPSGSLIAASADVGGDASTGDGSPALAPSGETGAGASAPLKTAFAAEGGSGTQRTLSLGGSGGVDDVGVSVVPDEGNRMLLITATRDEYARIAGILDRIDVLADQVMIEATIAEVTLNDDLRFGLRWFFENGRSSFTFTDAIAGAIAPTFPGFSYFFNGMNVQVALDALSAVTNVNIISSPTLTVLDGRQAMLQVGDEVPIITQQVTGVQDADAPVVNSVTYRNTGIILNIVPKIRENGRVVLEIEQEVSEVGATTSSTINSPTIQQRRISTTVVVDDGESLAIGGLMQDRASRGQDKVPLLGDVPLVGNLFKTKRDTIRRTELLIVMTPRIIRDVSQVRQIANEFRDKMHFTLRPDHEGPPDLAEQLHRLGR